MQDDDGFQVQEAGQCPHDHVGCECICILCTLGVTMAVLYYSQAAKLQRLFLQVQSGLENEDLPLLGPENLLQRRRLPVFTRICTVSILPHFAYCMNLFNCILLSRKPRNGNQSA